MDGLCWVLQSSGETTVVVYNPGVTVSEMAGAKQQEMIYYIKPVKRIGRTCTHADVDLDKVSSMYHKDYMEEVHKDP